MVVALLSIGSLSMSLVIPILLVTLLIVYGFWPYRRYQHLPGPKPLPFLGNVREFNQKNKLMFQVYHEFVQKYGDVCVAFAGRQPMVFLADPKLVHEVAVTQFENFRNRAVVRAVFSRSERGLARARDERWRKLRRTMSPSFNLHQLKGMIPHIVAESQVLCDKIAKLDGKEFEIHEMVGLLTLDVMGRTAFGTRLNTQTSTDSELSRAARTIFTNAGDPLGRTNSLLQVVNLVFPFMAPIFRAVLPAPERFKEFVRSFNYVENSTTRILQQRRRQHQLEGEKDAKQEDADTQKPKDKGDKQSSSGNNGGDSDDSDKESSGTDVKWLENDFLELLLHARDKLSGEGLSDEDIVAQSITFLLAGHETTANLIAFTMYLLAQYPEIADKLCEECNGISDNPSVSELNNLSYMSNVIKESLRLYPPAPLTSRETVSDTFVGDHFIPKGSFVMVPIWTIHRSNKFWKDPEAFDPDRWLEDGDKSAAAADGEKAKKKFNLEWLPFGAGPRSCIGMRFALIEAKVVLSYLVKNFRFTLTAGQVPLPLKFAITMGPANGVHLRATPR